MAKVEKFAQRVASRMGHDVPIVDNKLVVGNAGAIAIIETIISGILQIIEALSERCRQPVEQEAEAPPVAVAMSASDMKSTAADMQARPLANLGRRVAMTRLLREEANLHGVPAREVRGMRDAMLQEVVQTDDGELDEITREASAPDYGWI